MSGLAIPTAKRPAPGLALPGASPSSVNSPAPSTGTAIQLQPRPSSAAAPQAMVAGGRVGESGRASASPSPEPDEDGDVEGDDDDDEGLGQSSKKSSKGSKKKKGATAAPGSGALEATAKQDYKYTNEIAQMVSDLTNDVVNPPDVRVWRSPRSLARDSQTGGRHCPRADHRDCKTSDGLLLTLQGHSRPTAHSHSIVSFPLRGGPHIPHP